MFSNSFDSFSALRLSINFPIGVAKYMARKNEYNEDTIHYESLFQPRFHIFSDPTFFLSYSYRSNECDDRYAK